MIIQEYFTEEGYGVTFDCNPGYDDVVELTFTHGDEKVLFDLTKDELTEMLHFMNQINDKIIVE